MTDASQEISTTLREAREAAGLSLESVAAELNIRVRFLEAIEDGDLEALPPPAFTAGFVRCYANHLGLDGHALSHAFREQMGATATLAELRFPEPVAESRLPGRAALLSGLVGMAAIYFGWIHDFAGATQTAGPGVEPVPARLAALETADSPAAEVSLASTGFRTAAADTLPREREPRRQAERSAGIPAAAAGPEAAAGPRGRIRVTAVRESWIRVVDGAGSERFSGVLRAGETWSPDYANGDGRLLLSTSNAGALRLVVDNEELAAIGEPGAIVEDIPLQPEQLKSEYTLAMH